MCAHWIMKYISSSSSSAAAALLLYSSRIRLEKSVWNLCHCDFFFYYSLLLLFFHHYFFIITFIQSSCTCLTVCLLRLSRKIFSNYLSNQSTKLMMYECQKTPALDTWNQPVKNVLNAIHLAVLAAHKSHLRVNICIYCALVMFYHLAVIRLEWTIIITFKFSTKD